MKKYKLLLCAVLLSSLGVAQDFPFKEINLAQLVDEILAVQDEDINYEDLYENYLQLLSNPYDLNSVSNEQLRSLYILSEQQVNSILRYRQETGGFISVYELQSVAGFDRATFLRLVPFVSVDDLQTSFNKNILKRILTEKNNYLLLRYSRTLENQKGYSPETDSMSRYAGTPERLYARFRVSRPGDFSLGFTAEKDPGETLLRKNKLTGPDYFSLHAQIQNKNTIRNLILGDYQAQFGQGLSLGSVFGIGKNAEAVTTLRRSNIGFVPYTSLLESGFLRGAALSLMVSKNLTIHAMASHRKRDGNLQQDATETLANAVSSFGLSGLHRTITEISNKNSVTESNFAGVINYKTSSIDAGLILHHTQFDVPLIRNQSIYNQFQFQGKANTNGGLFLNYSFKNFAFFSEVAQTLDHGNGMVLGVLTNASPKLDLSFLYRRFQKDFYSFYSNALSENSTPQNETGFYSGWKYTINKVYSLSGYVDFFQFPWLRYRSYSPSYGTEWLLRFNFKPSKTTLFFVQAREESKLRNTTSESNQYETATGVKRNYWINVDYQASPKLKMKTRAQFSTYQFDGNLTQGTVLLQDVSVHAGKFTISGRYALFDTDDYDNRLYIHEQDVWLAFSFPPYFGKGTRQYILLEYKLNKKIDVWLRWSQTHYRDGMRSDRAEKELKEISETMLNYR
jgi:DNA uptake protein and related DNA-binding proteins